MSEGTESKTSFLDRLSIQGDKVNFNELIEIRKLLPTHVTKAIPLCVFDEENQLDMEVMRGLSFILAKRENKDITLLEVGERLGVRSGELLRSIVQDILYFYTDKTREEVEDVYPLVVSESDAEPTEGEVEKPEENPTP